MSRQNKVSTSEGISYIVKNTNIKPNLSSDHSLTYLNQELSEASGNSAMTCWNDTDFKMNWKFIILEKSIDLDTKRDSLEYINYLKTKGEWEKVL